MKLDGMSIKEKEELLLLLEEKKNRAEGRKLFEYKPYPYQEKFAHASATNNQKALCAANRIGKSDGGAWEVTIHATGEYPEGWQGRKWERPVLIVCGGKTNQQVKDVAQTKLLGEPSDISERGKGFIPLAALGKTARKAGIPDALSSALVQHKSGGWSKISFISYDSGKEGWMGFSADFVWLDEEPTMEVYSQALRSIVDRGGLVSMTFTPENGVTEIVRQYQESLQSSQVLMRATWDDAPHITEEVKEQILAALPPHERKMRSLGEPTLGSGQVYPIAEEDITCDAFDIPEHWTRIAGIDFGIDHPTAWVAIAWDRDTDTVYVYDAYAKSGELPSAHANNIAKRGGKLIPTAWPHDGLITDKTSGAKLRDMYSDEGVRMLPEKFSNPDKADGSSGGNGVEFGIMEIFMRMQSGRFKVFSHLTEWFQEFRGYYRKDGKINKVRDDLMDATRYACLSVRFAETPNFKYEAYLPYEHGEYQATEVYH